MTGPTHHKAKRMRPGDDRDSDRRLTPTHMFRDIGPAAADPDYLPRTYGNPDQDLALIFSRIGRDYGGPLLGPSRL